MCLLITFITTLFLFFIQFKAHPLSKGNLFYLFPNFITYFIIIVILMILLIKYFILHKKFSILLFNKIPIILITGIVFLFVIRVRLIRNKSEPVPYKLYFENHSIINDFKKSSLPFRAGAISYPYTYTLNTYGIETADSRGPISHKYYKEFFKLIISPQLTSQSDHKKYDNYWYNINLVNGKNGIIDFNVPLLLFLNIKYLVSSEHYKNLTAISSSVIYSKSDNYENEGILRSIKNFFNKNQNKLLPDIFYTKYNVSRYIKKLINIKSHYISPIYIYKLKNTFERAFLVNKICILPDNKNVLKKLANQSIKNLRETAFYSKEGNKNFNLSFNYKINKNNFKKNIINIKYYMK